MRGLLLESCVLLTVQVVEVPLPSSGRIKVGVIWELFDMFGKGSWE